NARIVDSSQLDVNKVSILTTVKIKNLKNNMEMKYTIVAENEADLKSGKISIDSPIGKALVGKKVGENVDVTVPAGVIPFQILEISL
ncbi:MAG: GreA/GreB family elongation factor, partial [Bacteroidia bacterium]|nr:GreA/GreB family elongation factor [Bacteroidia bacterium]